MPRGQTQFLGDRSALNGLVDERLHLLDDGFPTCGLCAFESLAQGAVTAVLELVFDGLGKFLCGSHDSYCFLVLMDDIGDGGTDNGAAGGEVLEDFRGIDVSRGVVERKGHHANIESAAIMREVVIVALTEPVEVGALR